MLRRLLSMCLVICLLLGLGAMNVFATETQAEETEPAATETVTEPTESEPAATESAPTEPVGETVPEEIPDVPTEEVLKTSDDAIAILKLEEGFSTYPYWDYSQWTVGYGTKCPDDKLSEYRANGISKEAAEQLLREFIVRFESEIHGYMIRTGIQLDQKQFDALLMFSYNCGTGWSHDSDGLLYNTIARGATGNDLINAFSRWCNAGGEIKSYLLRRRLCEANIYLNGIYSQTPPANFGYVIYDGNGGTAKPNVQGYNTDLTATILSQASREGYKFLGWYTEKTGGQKVERLDANVRNTRIYARWESLSPVPEEPEVEEQGVTVTVTANSLNVRSGAGTSYAVVGMVNTGRQLVITQTKENGGILWGKFSGGWIALNYTNYDIITAPEEEPEPAAKQGTVRVNDVLRVRSGPSTCYSVVTTLKNGEKVEILEEKPVGTMVWGRIEKGWVSMDYIVLDDEEETPETQPPVEEPPQQNVTPEPQPPAETPEATQKVRTGKVKVNDVLRVRSGPSTDNTVVGYLKAGEKVTVTEQTSTGNMTWGKIGSGWVSMDYIELDPDTTEPEEKLTGTVTVGDVLRVRSGPGTSYPISAYLTNGTKVEITERKTVAGISWGKMDKGWICLDYVKLDNAPQAPEKVTKTITADCLRIRSTPGTSGTVVGYYYMDAKVEILETQTVNGTQWGKTAKGWISMDYTA